MRDIFMIFFILSIVGCMDEYEDICDNPKFSFNKNEFRQKHDIPVLEKTWKKKGSKIIGDSIVICQWINDSFLVYSDIRPFHYSKDLVFHNSELKAEVDKYRHPEKFKNEHGKLIDQIVLIRYNYDKDVKWESFVRTKKDSGWISLKRAKDILKNWGISNYP